MFSGSIPALVTPFRDGAFDRPAFCRLVEWQIENGSAALVPCGTTGESPTISLEEHMLITDVCIEVTAGRVPVIAGAGSNSTADAVMLARHAEEAGADAVLVVTPYYNKPNQEGLFQHFKCIHDAIGIPIVLYNIPGRSIVDLALETIVRLAELPRIVGMKDATGDIARVSDYRRTISESFCQLSGCDESALAHFAHGGMGCISVSANVAPRLCADFQAACAAGDMAGARALNDRLHPLHRAMFADCSPGPVKYAMSRVLDWMTEEVRLPVVACNAKARAAVDEALVHAGLL
ncbi:4-hydroxy-tetrahydrodipicolinate synthase [Novosphingobium mangrovi (ex Huang et al. 2023)]|uniref:4-hydroxy-tetrahydrodipicolinate synthase n=1 Tax=Novosphingobium mangrovi (ex Huang et al. 2023) TaxID=2976432 RepID=A0ABT2I7C8_9SPHN|nr:4-hydroxy-tetrahydrodipicolinate synthase [Novosphingobium mangrovi (ex Huang et al. 2023)]MCT2400719.1 4-hydroxy-tetrahydrodipicolinate synthase [Novosphingobium mangrovi (ex Huang et al. 2023)]